VQFYVYELRDEDVDQPRRVTWQGWRDLQDWLHEEGLDADTRMARQLEYRQVRQVAEETADVEEMRETTYVSPLPDLRGATMMFGIATEDSDYIVSPVPLQWLLQQAVNGWEVAMTFSVERVGGRETEGYFNEDA
jgi:hypothetical protein